MLENLIGKDVILIWPCVMAEVNVTKFGVLEHLGKDYWGINMGDDSEVFVEEWVKSIVDNVITLKDFPIDKVYHHLWNVQI